MLTKKQIEDIEFDIKETAPSSSPMGLFRQHCMDLLAERLDLIAEVERLRGEVNRVLDNVNDYYSSR